MAGIDELKVEGHWRRDIGEKSTVVVHFKETAFVRRASYVDIFRDAYNNAVPLCVFRILSSLGFLCVDLFYLLT